MVQIEEIPSEPVIVPVKKKENVSPKKEKADIRIEEKVKPKKKAKRFTISLNNVEPKKDDKDENTPESKLEKELDWNSNKSNFPRMTKEALMAICKKNKQYRTPYLNDQLYLHFKGWWRIENLEEYTGVRCLWLESNGLRKIEGLGECRLLRSLYLQQNLIEKIENLETCQMLCTLNLESNLLKKLENLDCLPELQSLNISNNHVSTYEGLLHLKDLKKVSVLDLQNNRIEDPRVVEIFESMESLRVLNLTKNSVPSKIRNYRKTMIVRCKDLTYLDDRPVFPRDRACAEAWAKGGIEAEKEERQKWQNKDRQKMNASVAYLRNLREKAEAKRAAMEAAGEVEESASASDSDSSKSETEEKPCARPIHELMNEEANENDEDVSEKSFSMDDLPDLESVAISEMSDLTQAKQAPKGFRNVMVINESDSDSDSDSEDIVLNRPSAEPKAVETDKASENKENPKSNFLESSSETSSILNIAKKPDEDVEMLFQKVERPQEPLMQASAAPASKPVIQELDSDDEES